MNFPVSSYKKGFITKTEFVKMKIRNSKNPGKQACVNSEGYKV